MHLEELLLFDDSFQEIYKGLGGFHSDSMFLKQNLQKVGKFPRRLTKFSIRLTVYGITFTECFKDFEIILQTAGKFWQSFSKDSTFFK